MRMIQFYTSSEILIADLWLTFTCFCKASVFSRSKIISNALDNAVMRACVDKSLNKGQLRCKNFVGKRLNNFIQILQKSACLHFKELCCC